MASTFILNTCWEASKAAGSFRQHKTDSIRARSGGRNGKSIIIGKEKKDVLHTRGLCMSGKRRVEGLVDVGGRLGD